MRLAFSEKELRWGAWFAMGFNFPRSARDALVSTDDLPVDVTNECEELLQSIAPQFGGAVEEFAFQETLMGGFALTKNNSLLRLTSNQYDRARDFALSVTDPNFQTQAPLWPATKLTLINRIGHGSWPGVERSIGLQSQLCLPDPDLDAESEVAMVNFWHFCHSYGLGPSTQNYSKWRRVDKKNRSSLDSVMSASISWATALSLAFSNYSSADFEPWDAHPEDERLAEKLRYEGIHGLYFDSDFDA